MRWLLILIITVPVIAADEFESVCVIPGFGATPAGDTWTEDQVYVVVKRTVNGSTVRYVEQFTPLDWGEDDDYAWFVDCAWEDRLTKYQPGQDAIEGTDAVLATYKYTYISENGSIWGVPFTQTDVPNVVRLDADDAVNVGGGTVGLNYNNADEAGNLRFVAGDVVDIRGTDNYNSTHTLTAGTSLTQLQFTDTYNAETFDGTETVSKLIVMQSGSSRMVADSSGNLYYGHNWDAVNSTYVTKVQTDGTLVYNALTAPAWPILGETDGLCLGLAISDDDAYLYVMIKYQGVTDYGYIHKFDLSDGSLLWVTTAVYKTTSSPGYDIAIDSDGNCYSVFLNDAKELVRCASADGSVTTTELYEYDNGVLGGYYYAIAIDNTEGKIVMGGVQWDLQNQPGANLKNMLICDLDGSNQVPVQVGGFFDSGSLRWTPVIHSGNIVIYNGYIYVLTFVNATTATLYKYDFDGNELASQAVSTYGAGLFADSYGNIVVVDIDWTVATTERYYFYDSSDFSSLGSAGPFTTTQLRTWDSAGGGAWIQGGVVHIGELGTPAEPGQDAIAESWETHNATQLDGETVCVYADGIPRGEYVMDGNDIVGFTEESYDVVIAGLNYWSIYKSPRLYTINDDGRTNLKKHRISTVNIDFWDSMGADLGIDRDNKSTIQFSNDDWATAIDPFTGYKAPIVFPRGITRDMSVYLEEWEPIPMNIRGIYAEMEAYDN